MSRGGITTFPPKYTGFRVTQLKAEMLAKYGDQCHICGDHGADTVDHLIPRSFRPDLAYDLENVLPAHRKCNSSRGNRPMIMEVEAAGW